MAVQLDAIRGTAERVAGSYGLDVVEIEFQGGVKFRTLRVYIEKNATERAKLAEAAAAGAVEELPKGVPAELLSGVTHEDCATFSRDFGTVLDVEDLIPGGEYTLEVSSPGLDRKLKGIEDYRRFAGMLVKVQTFEPVAGNRHWQGRIAEVGDASVKLALKRKGAVRGKKAKSTELRAQSSAKVGSEEVEITLANIEKANLAPEI